MKNEKYIDKIIKLVLLILGITNPDDRIEDFFFLQGDLAFCMVFFYTSSTILV